jgi:hypothetical protein
MHRYSMLLCAAFALTVATACQDAGTGVVEVDAEGTVVGLAWLDLNGSGQLEPTDAPVRDVRVHLMARHGTTPLHTATSAANGEFIFNDIPVGDYRAVVDTGSVGDTLRILRVDSALVTVAADDIAVVLVGLTYPSVPITEVRSAPVDSRVFIEGLVLTRWGNFGESTLHVRDTTGAIRVVRAQQTGVIPGDSVRVLGAAGLQSGQPVVRDGVVFLLRTGVESPRPDTVNTATAASARGGLLDADLVRVDSAAVQDTSRTPDGDLVITVNDGSGRLDVVLSRFVSFQFQVDGPLIGQVLRATGVLVPATAVGSWVLMPRSNSEISIGPLSYPTLPIAQARQAVPDTRLIVEGRALNAWGTFGEATVHVRDATGAIRAVRMPQINIAAGDSIRVVGTRTTDAGQPALDEVWSRVLRVAATLPALVPDSVATAVAAHADNGRLDAGLLRVRGAIQATSFTPEGDLVLTVDDDSGPVRVLLHRNVPFNLNWPIQGGQPQIIGTTIRATGVLVPRAGTDEWHVQPRSNADVQLSSGG